MKCKTNLFVYLETLKNLFTLFSLLLFSLLLLFWMYFYRHLHNRYGKWTLLPIDNQRTFIFLAILLHVLSLIFFFPPMHFWCHIIVIQNEKWMSSIINFQFGEKIFIFLLINDSNLFLWINRRNNTLADTLFTFPFCME